MSHCILWFCVTPYLQLQPCMSFKQNPPYIATISGVQNGRGYKFKEKANLKGVAVPEYSYPQMNFILVNKLFNGYINAQSIKIQLKMINEREYNRKANLRCGSSRIFLSMNELHSYKQTFQWTYKCTIKIHLKKEGFSLFSLL